MRVMCKLQRWAGDGAQGPIACRRPGLLPHVVSFSSGLLARSAPGVGLKLNLAKGLVAHGAVVW